MNNKTYYITGLNEDEYHISALGYKLILCELFSYKVIESSDKLVKLLINNIEFETNGNETHLLSSIKNENELKDIKELSLFNNTIKKAKQYFNKEILEYLKDKTIEDIEQLNK